MPGNFDSQLRRALAERIRYYNELGIYDFYHRDFVQDGLRIEASSEAAMPLPSIEVISVSYHYYLHLCLNQNCEKK